MRTAIFMWGSTSRIRNMARERSFGSVSVVIPGRKMPIRGSSSMKGSGGEACPMDRGSIKKLMVIQGLFR
jgi:hypothetical protein